MKVVADTNTFMAVALDQPERRWLAAVTEGCSLVAPSVLPYEIGNALSALVKRKAIAGDKAPLVWDAVQEIPVELVQVDIRAAGVEALLQPQGAAAAQQAPELLVHDYLRYPTAEDVVHP